MTSFQPFVDVVFIPEKALQAPEPFEIRNNRTACASRYAGGDEAAAIGSIPSPYIMDPESNRSIRYPPDRLSRHQNSGPEYNGQPFRTEYFFIASHQLRKYNSFWQAESTETKLPHSRTAERFKAARKNEEVDRQHTDNSNL